MCTVGNRCEGLKVGITQEGEIVKGIQRLVIH